MTRPALAAFAALSMLAAVASAADTADATRAIADYSVTAWSESNGVPLGSIYCIAQDRRGYLWVGGPSGLRRFDGVRFADAATLGLAPLPDAPVMALHVARRDGSLWVGFGDGHGVRVIRDRQLLPVTPETALDASATDLGEDASGDIWAATDRGIFHHSRRWEEVPLAGGVRGQQALRVYLGRRGTLWVGTRMGLQTLDAHGRFHPVGPRTATVMGVAEDADGRVFVTDPAVGIRPAAVARPGWGLQGRGFFLFRDSRAQFWVGTIGQGLWRVRGTAAGRPSVVGTNAQQVSDGVWYVFEDRERNIWAGTTHGLVRLLHHTMTPVVDYGLVRTVESAARDGIWIGTANGVIRLAGSSRAAGTRVPGLDGIDISAIDVDRTGALWAAAGTTTWRVSGSRLDRGPTIEGAEQIRSLAADGRGGLWLVDDKGRLSHWSHGTLASNAFARETAQTAISFVHVDHQQRLWVVFENGQLGLAPLDGPPRLFGAAEGWHGSARTGVNTIAEDRDGAIWIGSNEGLTRFRTGRFASLSRPSALSGRIVRALVADDLGYLWLGIDEAIVRIDPDEFDRALQQSGAPVRIREFDVDDGVAGVVFAAGNGSAARAGDGRLFFVTGRGLTTVDPRTVDDLLRPPPSRVHVERLVADDEAFDAPGASLPAGTTRLRIEFTIPTLTAPSRTRFRYRLEGYDRDWIDAGLRRQAFYAHVPAGDYRFVVRAEIPERAWTSETTGWDFRIAQAFYQTGWFYALCVGVLALAAGGAWRLRVRAVHREVAAVYGERMRLGREIHDTLLQSLAGLALQLDGLAGRVAGADAGAASQLQRVREQMARHMLEVRESIWDLRSPDPRPRSLVDAIGDGVRRLVASDVTLQVDVVGTPRPCPERVGQHLLRIAREAVLNAVRHGKARCISLTLAYDRRALRLTVADDGCGFEPSAIATGDSAHYGLSAMRERAAAAGGSCVVASHPGAGTAITVELPLLSRWSLRRLR